MKKSISATVWGFISVFVFLMTTSFAGAQMQMNSQPAQTGQTKAPGHKVSMRQMGMGKMKNSQRWKAAMRRADRRAAAVRVHGKGAN